MAEVKAIKREWVKNAAIVFLSVLLVLTFFSNTFMNHSLPEVSTQYVSGGTINEKIRGSGTVVATEEYLVETDQSRKIETVCIKVGQTVNAGDVLFVLGEGDSQELEDAKEVLYDMELAYEKQLIQAAANGNSDLSRSVDEARKAVADAKDEAKELRPSATGSESAVKAAEERYNEAVEVEAIAQEEYNEAKAKLDVLTGGSSSETTYEDETPVTIATNAEEIIRYQKLYDEADANYKAMVAERDKHEVDSENYEKYDKAAMEWKNARDAYDKKLLELANNSNNLKEVYDDLYKEVVEKEEALSDAKAETAEAQEAFDTAKANLEEYKAKSAEYEAALDRVEVAESNLSIAIDNLEAQIEADEIAEKIRDLDFADMKRDIEKQREKVADLSGGEGGNEIIANVGGTVSEISVKAGETSDIGTPLAVIELSDRGYTLSVSVTSEQAKKVSIGDAAEVSTYWWGSQIKAVLREIRNDAQSSGRNKILVFELSGDIEPGMNVDISIGQRSRNYDTIVPKSAVRSDSNGDFVLMITVKSSPLGNRYTATRVDVQVLASDDIYSAVSGIGSGEYVITTSSAPIEAGMLVRMAEG